MRPFLRWELRPWPLVGIRAVLGALAIAAILVAVTSCQLPSTPSTAVPPTSQPTLPPPTSAPAGIPSPSPTEAATATPSPTKAPEQTATATVPPPATPTSAPPSTPATAQANSALWKTGSDEFRRGNMAGLRLTSKGLELAENPSVTSAQGQLTSAVETAPFPFNNAVLSWAADAPANTSLKLELRARVGESWSPWYTMGTWSNGLGASVAGQKDTFGEVDIDTLKLRRPAQALQYRATLSSSSPQTTPTLRSVAVAYADLSRPLGGQTIPVLPNWVRDLPVPAISQAVQEPSIRWEICSPTSLTMVLKYWSVQTSLLDVVRGVRDHTTGIYGNWPLNTAYAATLGFDAHVVRFHGLEQLQNEIAQGRPVAVSLKYDAGQLNNAPLRSTSGHLIVVRGFTASGDVIVNDPAAPDHSSVRRVYQRDQFTHVWLGSGGVAYVLAPATN